MGDIESYLRQKYDLEQEYVNDGSASPGCNQAQQMMMLFYLRDP